MNARTAMLALAPMLASLAGTAGAATVYWNVNGPTNQWNTAANWVGGRVPGLNDFVVIPAGGSPALQGNIAFIAGLFIQPGANLLIFQSLYVEGGASIQGNMSIVGARFLHRDDVNLEGQVMMWSGASMNRRSSGTGVFTVRPSGSILIRSDNVSEVTIATALQVQGLLDDQSNQALRIGKVQSDSSDGTYIAIDTNGTMRFTRSAAVSATIYAGQSTPYIVNSGFINVEGSLSNVVDIAANLPVFNAGTVYVNQPDLHIRSSWDFAGGTLTRGFWACQNVGRIFFDNNTMSSVGSGVQIYLGGNGSQIVQLSQAQENFGSINLDYGAYLNVNPAGGSFTNHGLIQLSDHSNLGVVGQFSNPSGGVVESWISGATPYTYGTIYANSAILGGTLTAKVAAAYTPTKGDTLTLVNASQWVAGQFDAVNVLYTQAPFLAVYGANTASLVVGCPADFNADGAVDFFDYDDFVNCFEGVTCPGSKTADFNNDAAVDFFDYDDFVVAFETPC